ncbi:hypothetical protein OJAV_G00180280 [Oryzias javanicus]|uniref:Immunoglobulin subtype domain-containing protein n=1 Tax=Oryzias javanicus TaxID=123683 RepID=A0A3S2PGA7_ORYJA|nr:hypothetical protein OJAV_G00180280 [Oryzias javanicus]
MNLPFPICYFTIMSRFITFLLLNCWVLTGILGNDEPEPMIHYVQKYQQLCLYVKEPPPYKSPRWNFKITLIADEKEINPIYTKRVEINHVNMSLCINNMNESDTGLYTFTYTNTEFTTLTHRHQVIVEEEVPNPQMTVRAVRPSNQSALPCEVNVTCSIQNHLLVSFCGEESCEISQKTFGNLNISIYVRHKTAVCSGNNHVSNNTSSRGLPSECFTDEPKNKEEAKQTMTWRVIYSTIGFIIAFLLCAAFIVICGKLKLRRHKKKLSIVQTIQSAPFERDQQPEPRLSASSSSDAEPSYENMDDTQIRERSGPTEDQEEEKVNTVYSVLGAASEYVIPDEPQSMAETDC